MAATREMVEWALQASANDLAQAITISRIEDALNTPKIYEIGSTDKQVGFVRVVIDDLYRNYGRTCPEIDGQLFAERFVQTCCTFTIGDVVHFADKCVEEYDIDYLNPAAIWKSWRTYLQYRGNEMARIISEQEKASKKDAEQHPAANLCTPEELHECFQGIYDMVKKSQHWYDDYRNKGPKEVPGVKWAQLVTYDKYLAYRNSQEGYEKDHDGNWHRIDEERKKYWEHHWNAKIVAPIVKRYNESLSK